jgi:LEA14-like dessication related protein
MPASVLVKATGVTIGWELGMKNENAVAIPVQSVQAHVVIDDSMDLGTASVSEAVTLPSQKETVVPVSTDLAWSNMGQLGQLAMAQRDVKYKADGTVTLGGALVNVTVPFTATGVITQQDLVRGAMQGLPLLLPR